MTQTRDIGHELSRVRGLIQAGRLEEALASNGVLLESYPSHCGVLLQAARLAYLKGQYVSARELTLKAFAGGATDPSTMALLITRLQSFHLSEEARALACAAQMKYPAATRLLDVAATALNQLNEPAAALDVLSAAVEADGQSCELRITRAQTNIFLGRFSEAEEDIDFCLSRRPEMAFAWWLRSKLGSNAQRRTDIDQLRRLLDTQGITASQDVAFLGYALHNELDTLGDTQAAGKALEHACAVKRSLVNYNPAETKSLFDALRRFESRRMVLPNAVDEKIRTPIFVVGMHRSGTTLLEQLLDQHSEVRGLGELYDFSAQMRFATDCPSSQILDPEVVRRAGLIDMQRVGEAYIDAIRWRLGPERFFVDKLPSNFLNLGFILDAIPHAKVLHLARDPMETCFSNLRELFADGTNAYSYDQLELAEYYKEYAALLDHWHERFPGRILDVDFSTLTRAPEKALRAVADFCGLEFEASMLHPHLSSRAVTTASAVQVRKRIEAAPIPKWVAYSKMLCPLSRALGELGYRY